MQDTGLALSISQPHVVGTINALLQIYVDALVTTFTFRQQRWIKDAFGHVRVFSYVCGAVDGSLIEIARRRVRGLVLHGFYSYINMQAVSDHRRRFMDYETRPGSYSGFNL
ncbi:hypothetical protein GN958_ATG00103, partial [Phytophthora infestans]